MKKRGILVCAILFFVCVAGGIGYVALCNQTSRLPQEADGPPVRPEPEEGVSSGAGEAGSPVPFRRSSFMPPLPSASLGSGPGRPAGR